MQEVAAFVEAARAHEHEVYHEPNTGCWLWSGCSTKKGYGMIAVPKPNGKPFGTGAHRVFFVAARGAIPDGLTLDHLCMIKLCVNPDHLEIVTRGENTRRARLGCKEPKPSHCKRGHAYTPETTFAYKDGRWECKTCMAPRRAAWQRAYRAKLRQERGKTYWTTEVIG